MSPVDHATDGFLGGFKQVFVVRQEDHLRTLRQVDEHLDCCSCNSIIELDQNVIADDCNRLGLFDMTLDSS